MMKKYKKNILIVFFIFCFLGLFTTTVMAEFNYTPLAPIDGYVTDSTTKAGLEAYIANMYRLGVGIATLLAVLMVIWGGVEYMTTDAWGHKEEGKERIQAALFGLMLALGSYIIITTIDESILDINFNVLENNKLKVSDQFSLKVPESVVDNESSYTDPITGEPYQSNGETDHAVHDELEGYLAGGGRVVKDNSGRTGKISPQIAWAVDNLPKRFTGLKAGSTFRSPEHNHNVGGATHSAHLPDENGVSHAVDFFNNNTSSAEFSKQGNDLVEWTLQNGRSIGANQVIFQDKNYRYNSATGQWHKAGTVGGHYDHVHIGTDK